jgi:hypothetical protein
MWTWKNPPPEWERHRLWGTAKGALGILDSGRIPILPEQPGTMLDLPETYYETVAAMGYDPLGGE